MKINIALCKRGRMLRFGTLLDLKFVNTIRIKRTLISDLCLPAWKDKDLFFRWFITYWSLIAVVQWFSLTQKISLAVGLTSAMQWETFWNIWKQMSYFKRTQRYRYSFITMMWLCCMIRPSQPNPWLTRSLRWKWMVAPISDRPSNKHSLWCSSASKTTINSWCVSWQMARPNTQPKR